MIENQSVNERLSENARKLIDNANCKVVNISEAIKIGNIHFSELEKLVLNELKIQDVLNAADVEPKNIGIFKDVLDELHRFITSAHLLVSIIGPKAIKG
jgi:D-ribose pyranose/furanose isomerase RbsD